MLNGKLSLVLRCKNSSASDKFNIYNLDWRRNKWIKVENIGDYVVVLGKNCSKTVAAGRGFAANSIYFIYDAGKNLMQLKYLLTAGKHCESLQRFSGLPALSWFKPEL